MSPMVKLPLTIEHALLGLLYRRPLHGYQLHQELTEAHDLGLVWRLKEAQLYRLLGRLEEEGYVEATSEAQGTRPPRKVLRLTPAGEAAFLAWVRSPVHRGRELRLEFLAKLYFARQLGGETVRDLVEAQRQELQEALDDLTRQADALRQTRIYDWLVLEFRIGQLGAMLAWLATCETALAFPPSPPGRGEVVMR